MSSLRALEKYTSFFFSINKSWLTCTGLQFAASLLALNYRASLVAQTVKNLPAMQKAQVQSLGWEDPLDKEMATNSSIIAWRIPWTVEPGGLPPMGSQRAVYD